LGFETLTYVPIDYKLIDRSLLSPVEHQWLNDYHHACWEKLSPLSKDDDFSLQWLKRYTNPL